MVINRKWGGKVLAYCYLNLGFSLVLADQFRSDNNELQNEDSPKSSQKCQKKNQKEVLPPSLRFRRPESRQIWRNNVVVAAVLLLRRGGEIGGSGEPHSGANCRRSPQNGAVVQGNYGLHCSIENPGRDFAEAGRFFWIQLQWRRRKRRRFIVLSFSFF